LAVVLVACACSPQCGKASKLPATTPLAAATTPSPSPTPTAPLQASSPAFHGGEVGLSYAPVALTATGGVAPYTWTVSSGELPGGITLGPNGSVGGAPTSAGTFTFTIRVADAGDSFASVPGTITVAPQLAVGLMPGCQQYCNVELGCASVCGAFGQQNGGVGPYTYTLTQGPLPAGTSLSGLSLAGTFKGTSGWLQFTVQVTDSYGATASLAPRFWMYDPISLSSGTCTGRFSCKVTLPYSGGVPGPQPSIAPTAWAAGSCGFTAAFPCPKPGFAATFQPGSVTLTLSYPNSPNENGTLTVQLTENNLFSAGVHCAASATVKVG
jgi:hypothetical protein